MKKIIAIVVFFTACFSLLAQDNMKSMSDASVIKTKMQAAAAKLNSIESNFSQDKFMSVMASSMISQGKFYYKKSDKVALFYETPFKQTLVMNGNKLMMEANGKKNVIDASSNPMMGELKKIITACMSGNITEMGANYKMVYFENSKYYLIQIFPQTADLKKVAQQLDLYLDKSDMTVAKMKMIEPVKSGQKQGDYTEYQFSNKKLNSSFSESVFSIK